MAKKETAAPSKVPPHNREAEQSVLGAMLFDERAVGQTIGKLSDYHFYDEAHRRIFRALVSLYNQSSPIDLISVSDVLRKAGELESVGGATYLAQLLDMVPTVAHVEYYSRIVLEKAWLRDLLTAATEIMTEALAKHNGNVSRAATEMGVSRGKFYDLQKKYKLNAQKSP